MAARAAKVLAGSNPSAGTGEDENDPNKPPPAGRITVDLLRRRAEHNDGMITTLEEVSLHQQDLERIELLDQICRELKIVYLQNNLIAKIENVRRLKMLEYLNLALNNIRQVENLQRCESLNKLDLTINFIDKKGLLTIESLVHNEHLRDLYLVGNPGMDWKPGKKELKDENKGAGTVEARLYVVAMLPQVTRIDGKDVRPSERIVANQRLDELLDALESELIEEGVDPEEVRAGIENQSDAESDDDDDDIEIIGEPDRNGDTVKRPWSIKTRLKEHREMSAARREHDTKREEDMKRLAEGEGQLGGSGRQAKRRDAFPELPATDDVRQRNEPRLDYSIGESSDGAAVLLDVEIGKFMDTSLVDVDVQPSFVRLLVKGKMMQLLLPEQVHPDRSNAQRSKATGHLVVTMPKVDPSRFGTARGFYTNDQGPRNRARPRGELRVDGEEAPELVKAVGAKAETSNGGGAVKIRGIVRQRARNGEQDDGEEDAIRAVSKPAVQMATAGIGGDDDDDSDGVPDL